jgi:hypothetical protein
MCRGRNIRCRLQNHALRDSASTLGNPLRGLVSAIYVRRVRQSFFEASAGLDDGNAVTLLRQPQRGHAAAESGTDNNPVVVHSFCSHDGRHPFATCILPNRVAALVKVGEV